MAIVIGNSFSEAGSMAVGALYAHVFVWDGTKLVPELVEVATGAAGALPVLPIPMSAVPVVKTRVDVHPFSFSVGPTARRSGHLNLPVPAGMSAFFNVIAYQSANPGAGKGARPDAREFDQMLMTAEIVNDTTLHISWISTGPVIGNFNAYYQIKN